MDYNKNYYTILNVNFEEDKNVIKKVYYTLSKIHHPDVGGDEDLFELVCEAYKVLTNDKLREEYDTKSMFGAKYDESKEVLNFTHNNLYNESAAFESKLAEAISNTNNVIIYVEDDFTGKVTYKRYVTCKSCLGSGNDQDSMLKIVTPNGVMYLDADGECDFCEGTGKDYKGITCKYCTGIGKMGINPCKKCKGEKRTMGKQTVNDIVIPEDKNDIRIDFMGHVSKNIKDNGHLWIVRKNKIKNNQSENEN